MNKKNKRKAYNKDSKMPKVVKKELPASDKISFYNQQPWFEEYECGKRIY